MEIALANTSLRISLIVVLLALAKKARKRTAAKGCLGFAKDSANSAPLRIVLLGLLFSSKFMEAIAAAQLSVL